MSAIIFSMIQSLRQNRGLIFQLAQRDVLGRYKSSMMGMLWVLIIPFMMLTIYVFVFSFIFQSRWGENTGKLEFAGILFTGLIIYNFFSECMNRSPLLVTENVNYVKKIIFPVEIMPWVVMGSALFHFIVNLAVLFLFLLFVKGGLPWTVIFFPVVLLPLIMLILGFMWFLSSIGVYVRDLSPFVGMLTMAMLFLSPVLYPASAFPDSYSFIFYLNPLTFIIEQSRNVLLWGVVPDIYHLGIYLCISSLVAVAGFFWFKKTSKGFADVL